MEHFPSVILVYYSLYSPLSQRISSSVGKSPIQTAVRTGRVHVWEISQALRETGASTGLCIILLALQLTICSYWVKLQPRPPSQIISQVLYPKAPFFRLSGKGKSPARNFRVISSSQRAAASCWTLLFSQLHMTELFRGVLMRYRTDKERKQLKVRSTLKGQRRCWVGRDVLGRWHSLLLKAELPVSLQFKKSMCKVSINVLQSPMQC